MMIWLLFYLLKTLSVAGNKVSESCESETQQSCSLLNQMSWLMIKCSAELLVITELGENS